MIDPIHAAIGEDDTAKRPKKGSETRLTYSELRASIDAMAASLARLGVQREVRHVMGGGIAGVEAWAG